MLKLKIKDVVAQQLDSGYQIARIMVNGKTGTRNVRLNNSYPRLKDWLTNGHPFAGNPNAFLFCGIGRKNNGRRLSAHTINARYEYYKKVHFPTNVLQDPLVPEEDKRKIRDLLKKPWNPYVRRHTAATEISKTLKDSVLIDQYMGWSHSGNTRQKYQHYYNDDSIDAMLMMDGLVLPSNTAKSKAKNLLKPKLCPNCDETNKPESKFCAKCKFVLSFDAFNEAIEEKEKAAKEAEQQKKAMAELESRQKHFEDRIASNYDRLYEEVMRLSESRLASIKDSKEREKEMNILGVTGVEALDEMERQEEEEADKTRLEEEEKNDNDPRADDIDYQMELEIGADKNQQYQTTTRREGEE